MHTTVKYTNDLKYDHARWENELDFYKREICIFEEHLGDLLSRNLNRETLARIEQFQNQFIRQKEVVDELKHSIHVYEDELSDLGRNDTVPHPEEHLPKHMEMAQRIYTFHDHYMELRKRFNTFLVELLHQETL